MAFVAAASLALIVPRDDGGPGSQVTVDQQSIVVYVNDNSIAWQEGVRAGWHLVGIDPTLVYYGDELGNVRSVPNDEQIPQLPAIVEVLPAVAALAFAAMLAWLKLKRTSATVAVVGSMISAPVFATRFGDTGALVALFPVAIGAGLTWSICATLGFRPRPRRPVGPFLLLFVLPFCGAPAAAFAAATMTGGIVAGMAGATAVYLSLAWIGVIRWRIGLARSEVDAEAGGSTDPSRPARLAVARTLVTDLLPFSDRLRRRGAQAERNRLASDLHAELLPAIAMTASELERRGATDEAEKLRSLAAGVRDLVSERRLPILDEDGLVAAAEWLAESLQDRTILTIEINLYGSDGRRQPAAVERAAYRLMQLALDNVIRHSGAAHAFVGIQGTAHSLMLTIADDGHGMGYDPRVRRRRAGHFGLSDMRAEADSIGASLVIETRSPHGTLVEMKWPA